MNWISFTVIYCKTVQFATVNLNYSNLSYCKKQFEMSNSVVQELSRPVYIFK